MPRSWSPGVPIASMLIHSSVLFWNELPLEENHIVFLGTAHLENFLYQTAGFVPSLHLYNTLSQGLTLG